MHGLGCLGFSAEGLGVGFRALGLWGLRLLGVQPLGKAKPLQMSTSKPSILRLATENLIVPKQPPLPNDITLLGRLIVRVGVFVMMRSG